MSLSDWQSVPLVATGDLWTAAEHNTYIRNNQQILYDGLAAGHGSGSNADMVDNLHSHNFEHWDGYVDLDDNIAAGWVTIAVGGSRVAGWFEFSNSLLEYMRVFAAHLYTSTYSPTGSVLREWAYGRYWKDDGTYPNYWVMRGVRVLRRDSDHTAKLQIYWPGTGQMRVYQYTPNTDDWTRYGYLRAWTLVPPVLESTTDYSVGATIVPGNGAWRLARALSGGSGVGWMSAGAEQAIFTATTPALIDGVTNTSAVNLAPSGGWHYDYQYFTAAYPIALSGVRIWMNRNGGRIGWGLQYYDDTAAAWQDAVPFWYDTDGTGGTWQVNEKTFSRTIATKWRVVLGIYGDSGGSTAYFAEVQFYQSSNLVITDVPVGSAISLYDGSGTLLESVRNTAWDKQGIALFTANMADVAEIRITRPDGATRWLRFPTWAIDGGTLANGDVLTLYPLT